MLLLALIAAFSQDDAAVKAAVRRAIPLLEKSSAQYIEAKTCFSCHHQALPLLALTAAQANGFDVDAKNLKAQAKYTWDAINGAKKQYEQGRGQGGQIATASYALFTLEIAGWKPDESTAAVARYMADLESWKPPSNRPPQEASTLTSTALAVRGLRTYGGPEQKARIDRARDWLLQAKPKDTEDRVFRLWGLKDAGAETKAVEAASAELAAAQRQDGGWAQMDGMESDAYATGSALTSLHEAGSMKASDEPYRRGLKWLLASQKEDGSWHVATRSKPIQKYFESGFPHGKDQFISISATGWAVAALAFGSARP